MGFKDLVTNVTTKSEAIGAIGVIAGDKVTELLEEYKKATEVLAVLGFTVGTFKIGMGLLPEVHTTLSGTIDSIQKDKVDGLLQEHQDRPTTVMLLKALLLAKKVSDHIEGRLNGVTLHITLGVPPHVNVELH